MPAGIGQPHATSAHLSVGARKNSLTSPRRPQRVMADGGDKKEKKGSTRGGSQRKVSKSGKRYFKNPWIDEKPKESGCGARIVMIDQPQR